MKNPIIIEWKRDREREKPENNIQANSYHKKEVEKK